MATTNDLKNGLVLNIDGQLWTVVEFQHVKPGKGPAFVRTKLKHVLSGKVVDKNGGVAGAKVRLGEMLFSSEGSESQMENIETMYGVRSSVTTACVL